MAISMRIRMFGQHCVMILNAYVILGYINEGIVCRTREVMVVNCGTLVSLYF